MSERPGDAIAPLGPNIGTIDPSGSLSKTIHKTITLTAQMEEHRIPQQQPAALTPAEIGATMKEPTHQETEHGENQNCLMQPQIHQVISRNSSRGRLPPSRHTSIFESRASSSSQGPDSRDKSPRRESKRDRNEVFSEAEGNIIQAGLDVAQMKEEAEKERAKILEQRQAQDVAWRTLQERILSEETAAAARQQQVHAQEVQIIDAARKLEEQRAATQQVVIARQAELDQRALTTRQQLEQESIMVRQQQSHVNNVAESLETQFAAREIEMRETQAKRDAERMAAFERI